MFTAFKLAACAKPRTFSHLGMVRTKANQVHPGYAKFRKTQQRFQVDDGCSVHLKKGLPDKLLYWATCGLCVVGVAWSLKDMFSLIYPPENEQVEEEE